MKKLYDLFYAAGHKRYGYDFADLWLINSHNGIKEKDVKRIEINDYPSIKNT